MHRGTEWSLMFMYFNDCQAAIGLKEAFYFFIKTINLIF